MALGAGYVRPALWLPLVPNGTGSIIKAAALVFFAYLGFDVVAVTAEESRHPDRDVPFAIIGSPSPVQPHLPGRGPGAAGPGALPGGPRARPSPPPSARSGLPWAADLVALGAIVGITSVLYMLLLAQPRIALRHGPGRPAAPLDGGVCIPATTPPTA